MTKITFQQQSTPKGTATLDTANLMIGTDGRVFVRSSSDGRLVPLTDEQIAIVGQRFGPLLGDARLAMGALS